jgi:hypothetical protein
MMIIVIVVVVIITCVSLLLDIRLTIRCYW